MEGSFSKNHETPRKAGSRAFFETNCGVEAPTSLDVVSLKFDPLTLIKTVYSSPFFTILIYSMATGSNCGSPSGPISGNCGDLSTFDPKFFLNCETRKSGCT